MAEPLAAIEAEEQILSWLRHLVEFVAARGEQFIQGVLFGVRYAFDAANNCIFFSLDATLRSLNPGLVRLKQKVGFIC